MSHETIWLECHCESNMRLIYFTRCNHIQVFGVFACPLLTFFAIFLRVEESKRREKKMAVNGKPDSITWHFLNGVFVTHSDFIFELLKGFSANEMASSLDGCLAFLLLFAGCLFAFD